MPESPSQPAAPRGAAPMTPAALAAEEVRGRMSSWVAIGAVVLIVIEIVLFAVSMHGEHIRNTADSLAAAHRHSTSYILQMVLTTIAIGMMAPLLVHLAAAARDRLARTPRIVTVLALLGPALLAIGLPLRQIVELHLAKDFVNGKEHTLAAANRVLHNTGWDIAYGIATAGTLALGLGLILICIYSSRAGLLTRFIAAVGGIVGLAFGIGALVPAMVLVIFWLLAVAVLLLGPDERRPPAWAAGVAIAWPRFGRVPEANDGREDPADPDTEGAVDVEPVLDDGAPAGESGGTSKPSSD